MINEKLEKRLRSAVAALNAAVAADPKLVHAAHKLFQELHKEFRENNHEAYTAGVVARKTERIEKRALKQTALTEAKAAREEAKAKFQAALAIKVNENVAKRRKKVEVKPAEEMTASEVVDVEMGGLADIADIPVLDIF